MEKVKEILMKPMLFPPERKRINCEEQSKKNINSLKNEQIASVRHEKDMRKMREVMRKMQQFVRILRYGQEEKHGLQ